MTGFRPRIGRRCMGAAVLTLLVALLSAPTSAADDAAPDKGPPAAFVGDTPIDRTAIDVVIRRLHPTSKPTGEQRMQIEASVLEQLIDEALLRGELARQLVEVADGEIQSGIERLRGQLASRGIPLEAFLAESGRDEQGLREQIRLEVALDKYVRPRMTAETLEAFFEENRREFDGTRLRVSHIVLRPDIVDTEGIERRVRQAEAIRRDILQGRVTFDEAARRFSAGPSRHNGGDMGWIMRSGPMVEAFTKPVFAMAKGEVSKPLVTPFGVHLVKVINVEPGRIGLDAFRPRLEKMLAAKIVRDLLAKARSSTEITYTPGIAHFDPATPADGLEPRRILVEGSQ
ncbi:MAG: peptidylprolyl isomerase [Planctomycetes bacterium]|nr:peptidylprolyl isomerase [Planctomycetota bacterium]